MALVTIGDVTKEYPNGTTYLEIAEEYQPQYEDDILLVRINGKLRELHKKVKFDCRLEFFTGRDQPGIQTYHRSATFLMLKAFTTWWERRRSRRSQWIFPSEKATIWNRMEVLR